MTTTPHTAKIAFVTEDGETISAHFGRAPKVVIVTIENGRETQREMRDKSTGGHGEHAHHHDHVAFVEQDTPITHQQDHRHHHNHDKMLEAMHDCGVLIARGMGVPAMTKSENRGMRVVLVNEKSIDEALRAYLNGTLQHEPRRLHGH